MKVCPTCKRELPDGEFHKNKSQADGLSRQCKDCRREYYSRTQEQQKDKSKHWYHTHKGQAQVRRKTYYWSHKDITLAQTKQYNTIHADERRAYAARYRSEHPEVEKAYRISPKYREIRRLCQARREARLASLPHDLTPREWRRALKWFKHRCVYCGQECESLQQDHYIPLALGGGTTATNIVPACPACNRRKRDSDPNKWVAPETRDLIRIYFGQVERHIEGVML